ncbi:MAG: chemotaxis-specific protein-glutamate methyltransferase CheB, partial [Cyanobacteria bacterium J06635_1]
MAICPCAILIVTASVQGNTPKVFEAMGYGALDVVSTPILGRAGHLTTADPLLGKIRTIAKLLGKTTRTPPLQKTPQRQNPTALGYPLVVIGASTGGPNALATIFSRLPSRLEAVIIVVQHIDAQFTEGFVNWLDQQSSLPVALATPGCRPQAGQILVAGTNHHLVLQADQTLHYTANPIDNPYRPSVDVFFSSVAQGASAPGVGILLTGMGRDGAFGLGHLHQAGWHTLVQDQASSVVFGMPKAAIEHGAASSVLAMDAIAPALIRQIERLTKRPQ